MRVRLFVNYWLPVFAWMLLIFGASTDLGSSEQTSRFLIPFLRWLDPQISLAAIMSVQFLVRKAAHLTEYAIFAMLLLRALRSCGRVSLAQAAAVLAIAGGYAATDEFHQSFVATRTASPRDVLLDCCGAVLGLLVYWLLTQRRSAAPARGGGG